MKSLGTYKSYNMCEVIKYKIDSMKLNRGQVAKDMGITIFKLNSIIRGVEVPDIDLWNKFTKYLDIQNLDKADVQDSNKINSIEKLRQLIRKYRLTESDISELVNLPTYRMNKILAGDVPGNIAFKKIKDFLESDKKEILIRELLEEKKRVVEEESKKTRKKNKDENIIKLSDKYIEKLKKIALKRSVTPKEMLQIIIDYYVE